MSILAEITVERRRGQRGAERIAALAETPQHVAMSILITIRRNVCPPCEFRLCCRVVPSLDRETSMTEQTPPTGLACQAASAW